MWISLTSKRIICLPVIYMHLLAQKVVIHFYTHAYANFTSPCTPSILAEKEQIVKAVFGLKRLKIFGLFSTVVQLKC